MPAKNTKAFEFKLGKTGLGLLILGMSLLLLVVFSFGVTVGKHIDTYPEQLARVLPSLAKDRIAATLGLKGTIDLADAGKEPHPGKGPATATSAPGPIRPRRDAGPPLEGRPATAVPGMIPGAGTAPSAASSSSRAAPSRAGAAEEPVPALAPAGGDAAAVSAGTTARVREAGTGSGPGVPGEQYQIQVISYRDAEKAKRLSDRLRSFGYDNQVAKANIPGRGQWHRVIVGGFPNPDAAQLVADAIKNRIAGLDCTVQAAGGTKSP